MCQYSKECITLSQIIDTDAGGFSTLDSCFFILLPPSNIRAPGLSHLLRRRASLLVHLVRGRPDAALRDTLHLRLGFLRKLVRRRAQLTVRELQAWMAVLSMSM